MARPAEERPVRGVDLEAYWTRIGYTGSAAPTLDTLRALHRLHPLAIPFENLTTLLGESPPLDLQSLQDKMVHAGRGGYCFEHNRLFSGVLQAIGFKVTGLAARVLWERRDDSVSPRSHMLLAVKVADSTYISDVGFGGLTLTAPLLLEAGLEQATPHEVFRMMHGNGGYVLQVRLREEWRSLYWFDLHEHLDIDFEVLNHFVATHPQSPFPSQLFGALAFADGRLGLRNNRFTVYALDGSSERRVLATVGGLRDVLTGEFRIVLPENGALDAALERVIATGDAVEQ